MCIIHDTARKLGIEPKELFVRAMVSRGIDDVRGQAEYRFLQWYKHGNLTGLIENFCLDQWRSDVQPTNLVAPQREPIPAGRR
jgi:hypothetical protein